MSAKAVAVFVARVKAKNEEGRRPLPYNDATGKTVTCRPGGNLSVAYGLNLETGLDEVEMTFLLQHRAELMDSQLSSYPWYTGLDGQPTRQSVFLDVGYNNGLGGLLHYPHMIAAASIGDWTAAAAECTVVATNPSLDASRYAPLRQLLLHGDTQT